jgi:large subunit ribosomal protein L22
LHQPEHLKDTDSNLEMEAVAKLRNCPMSPRKMRLVVDQIRGMKVENALNILQFNQKRAYAEKVETLLVSAIANWNMKNEGSSVENSSLYVKEVFVDGGRMLKRLRTAPQGRAHRIRKRSNHITLVVDDLNATEEVVEVEDNTEENN